ncbi:cyclin-D-binding Myb-like transcription factor 1 isoform X2 [Lates japonicus]|uniref:Cyclin-D-binding Myb-like transcription factor 1 isoform X2 n=1 Tax=Lates japonicus TaxID=270547 RepID=A0AAD3QXC8_LATJO|nr:cyclin-D-binding Myb-like transcription factor 1 isoform X2 [Lates japonicus]
MGGISQAGGRQLPLSPSGCDLSGPQELMASSQTGSGPEPSSSSSPPNQTHPIGGEQRQPRPPPLWPRCRFLAQIPPADHTPGPSTCSPPAPQGPTTSRRHPIRACRSASPPVRAFHSVWPITARVTLDNRLLSSPHEHIILHSLSTDGLCSSDGVIIQTVTSDPTTSDPLSQSQLVVETEGRGQDDHLAATSLLEGAESVVTETQEALTDGFTDKQANITSWVLIKELSSPSVEGPVVHSGITPGSAVLIVSPPNISSTLTDPPENQEGSD